MTRVVHVLPVRERWDERLGMEVLHGRDVERYERQVSRAREYGNEVRPVPSGGGHVFWPNRCPVCSPADRSTETTKGSV